MPEPGELPVAVRASADVVRGRFGRRRRVFRWDALYADGRLVTDVDFSDAVQAARWPADAWPVRHAAEESCPEVGVGAWIHWPTGSPYDRTSGVR